MARPQRVEPSERGGPTPLEGWLTRKAAAWPRQPDTSRRRVGPTKPGGKTAITIRPGRRGAQNQLQRAQPASCSGDKKSPGGLAPPGSSAPTRHASIKERCGGGRGGEGRSCPDP